MNEVEQQIEQLEISIEQAKTSIEMADALERLYENKDFKTVITHGYFTDEASRLVLAKAMPELSGDEAQKDIENCIIAVGHLRQHLNSIFVKGNMAKKALHDAQDTREEILSEGEAA